MYSKHKRFKMMLMAGIMFLMLQAPRLISGVTAASTVRDVEVVTHLAEAHSVRSSDESTLIPPSGRMTGLSMGAGMCLY